MGAEAMDIQQAPVVVSRHEDSVTLALIGSIHGNMAWLENELKRVIGEKPRLARLDLGKMNYISSMGIGILMAFRREVVANGGSGRITAIDSRNSNVLRYA